MLGNFIYHNPTKIYFGKDSLNNLNQELKKYGKHVLLVYGGGSIKKNGIYNKVISVLKANKKIVKEVSSVMPNPTLDKLYDGLKIAKPFKPNLILAIGGGSVIDYAKALSVTINDKNPSKIWETYWIKEQEPKHKVIPVGTVLTMVGTGSEMNGGSVITNTKTNQKIGKHFSTIEVFPRFSILNPEFSYSIPYDQMVAGIFDIYCHLSEQYLSGDDNNTTDYLIEGLMRSLIANSLVAIKNPKSYEARSNIMWTSSWALNSLARKGKTQDWMPHKIGQAISGTTNATHGYSLSAIYIAYYKHILPYAVDKLARLAVNVWNVNPNKLTKKQIAAKGIECLTKWMKQLKVVMHAKQIGVTKQNIDKIVNLTLTVSGGYKKITKQDIKQILIKSL